MKSTVLHFAPFGTSLFATGFYQFPMAHYLLICRNGRERIFRFPR